MSKHKRLHSITGKGKFAKFAGFVSSHYGRPPKKKAPASVCSTGGGGVEQIHKAVSASIVHKDKEDCQA